MDKRAVYRHFQCRPFFDGCEVVPATVTNNLIGVGIERTGVRLGIPMKFGAWPCLVGRSITRVLRNPSLDVVIKIVVIRKRRRLLAENFKLPVRIEL